MGLPQQLTVPLPPLVTITSAPQLEQLYLLPIWFAISIPPFYRNPCRNVTILISFWNRNIISWEPNNCQGHYSPIICNIICLERGRLSKSTTTICCHVPRVNLLSLKGTTSEAPSREARTCEYPLPSPQRRSWS